MSKPDIKNNAALRGALEDIAAEVVEMEADMPECFEAVAVTYGFTLPSGMQVEIKVGRDILED